MEIRRRKVYYILFQKLEKRENANQAILSLKSRQNGKILKDQEEILREVKTFFEQLYTQKNDVQERIEINTNPSVIGRNDRNQSNKQFVFNPKCCGPKCSNTQCSHETPNHEELRMQSTMISRVKNKISPKNKRE